MLSTRSARNRMGASVARRWAAEHTAVVLSLEDAHVMQQGDECVEAVGSPDWVVAEFVPDFRRGDYPVIAKGEPEALNLAVEPHQGDLDVLGEDELRERFAH